MIQNKILKKIGDFCYYIFFFSDFGSQLELQRPRKNIVMIMMNIFKVLLSVLLLYIGIIQNNRELVVLVYYCDYDENCDDCYYDHYYL